MFKKIDSFSRNIIIVFAGTALLNFFNLACQLLIAHRLDPVDFAAFNSLLALYMIISSPFLTLQTGVTKYISEFNAKGEAEKIKSFLSGMLLRISLFAFLILIIFYYVSPFIMVKMQIPGTLSMYILIGLIFFSCLSPVFSGAMQGLELFNQFAAVSVIGGVVKLVLLVLFIQAGYKISGALGSFFISTAIALAAYYLIMNKFIVLGVKKIALDYKGFFFYLFPVAVSTLCYMTLVSSDMIMVKYYFSPGDAGIYSLAQMVGKIFLFLPGAISIVMFPRISGLHAKNMDTTVTLKKSLLYAAVLCVTAAVFYNIFPNFVLKILTGKTGAGPVLLGRLFSFSMSLFALLYVYISYFLSKKDMRFIGWLALFSVLQIGAINLFHRNLIQVQLALSINAFLLLGIHLLLYCKNPPSAQTAA